MLVLLTVRVASFWPIRMMPKGIGFAGALLLVGAMASGVLSQEPPPPPKPAAEAPTSQPQKSEAEPQAEVSVQDTSSTFRIRVDLVQVHVIVRGDSGKPVAGLHKEDFQLYDNGKLQTIATFDVEDARSRKERTEGAAKTQVNEGETNAQASVTAPERFIALTFDDIHLTTGDVAPMRIAADGFIDSMAPTDRVGIFTTSGLLTQDFSSDKELLKQELLKVMSRGHVLGHAGDCPNISYGMAVEVGKDPNAYAILFEQTQRCAPGLNNDAIGGLLGSEIRRVLDEGDAENRNVYRELENLLRLLASKPGERVLLLASPGFPYQI